MFTDWRLAWWLLRGQRAAAFVLIACLAIGVAARVGVGTLTGLLNQALEREARPLLGGDLEVVSNAELSAAQHADLAMFLPENTRTVTTLSFVTMGAATSSPQSSQRVARPLEVRAVGAGYPLYGAVTLDGARSLDVLANAPVALVQREALAQLGVQIGDTVELGAIRFHLGGVVLAEPGLGANPFALGPRVYVGLEQANASGLTARGARVRHGMLIALPTGADAEGLAQRLKKAWQIPDDSGSGMGGRVANDVGMSVRTARDAQAAVARGFDRLADFLRLIALLSLALGAVGVASLVRGFIAGNLDALAVLRVVGAGPGRTARMVLWQVAVLGFAGGVCGAGLGTLAANALAVGARTLLPVRLDIGVNIGACAWGVGLGVAAALAAAALPLLELARLKPLAVFRGEGLGAPRTWAALVAALLISAVFTLVAVIEARSFPVGSGIAAGVIVGGIALALIARIVLPALAWLRVLMPAFGARHGLANLTRAGFRPVGSVVAIGLSALLFGTLATYRASLEHELDPGTSDARPSLFVLDLQADQRDDFCALLTAAGSQREPIISPMISARFVPPKPVKETAALTREQERDRFFRTREQNLSYRDDLGADERIVAGRWLDLTRDEASVEENFAERLGVRLGDTITFDVQGVPISATITSLRAVRWVGMKPNFFVLLSPHLLENAPQTLIAAVMQLPKDKKATVQADLAARFPNLTVFDVEAAAVRVQVVVGQILNAVRVMGLFALAAGLAGLLGLGFATARVRREDAVLLKTIGATPATLALSLTVEFAALGGLSAVLGLALSVLLVDLAITSPNRIALTVPWSTLGWLAVAVMIACVLTGLAACRRVFSAKPAELLRDA